MSHSLNPLRVAQARQFVPSVKTTQRGLTLVELMVALAISTVITIAAVSALIVSRQGFTAVDAASQLRDNARFSTELIQRLGVQTGFLDVAYVTTPRGNDASASANPDPNITGFNNATASATDPANSSTTRAAGSVGYGSDVLILRYQAGETFPGSGVSDNTMIDCAGNPSTTLPTNREDRILSVLHVALSQGEPSLMCTTVNPTTGAFSAQPIIRGVENFQVLYGVDGVTPNAVPAAGVTTDDIADRYLRADQMVVAGDPVGTNANWRRVRSIRIGMIIRGPLGSGQADSPQTFYPLGQGKNSAGGALGSAMSSSADAGTVFGPIADSRLRQTVTFTVHLRNEQAL